MSEHENQSSNQGSMVVSDMGAAMMEIKSIRRDNDKLVIFGALMGAWDTDMYVDAPNVWRMAKMMLNKQVIGYVFALPRLLKKAKKDNQG